MATQPSPPQKRTHKVLNADAQQALRFLAPLLAAAIREGRFDRKWMSGPVRLSLTKAVIPAWDSALKATAPSRTTTKFISDFTRGEPLLAKLSATSLQSLNVLSRTLAALGTLETPTLPWLLALEPPLPDELADGRQRVLWAARVQAGRLIDDHKLANHLASFPPLHGLDLNHSASYQDAGVLTRIANVLGPMGDVAWLCTGNPTVPAWLSVEPKLRIDVAEAVPITLHPDAALDLLSLLDVLDPDARIRPPAALLGPAFDEARKALSSALHLCQSPLHPPPLTSKDHSVTWDVVLDEIPIGAASHQHLPLVRRSSTSGTSYILSAWLGPEADGWEHFRPDAPSEPPTTLPAVTKLCAAMQLADELSAEESAAKNERCRRPPHGGRRQRST
jgi:hypothetical protein